MADWLDLMLPRESWFHVPNGNKLKPAQAGINKAIGVKAGVPDIWIVLPPPNFPDAPGAIIELKRVYGSKTSDEQLAWLKRMSDLGWMCNVCKGADSSIKFLETLGYQHSKRRRL